MRPQFRIRMMNVRNSNFKSEPQFVLKFSAVNKTLSRKPIFWPEQNKQGGSLIFALNSIFDDFPLLIRLRVALRNGSTL